MKDSRKNLFWNFFETYAFKKGTHKQKKEFRMKKENILINKLNTAPYCSAVENDEKIRFDSLANLISDVKHEIYVIEEDELVEEAKDGIRCAKHYKAKPNTIRGLEAEYKGIKTEYKELKRYLKHLTK